jgi:hypothetical protein
MSASKGNSAVNGSLTVQELIVRLHANQVNLFLLNGGEPNGIIGKLLKTELTIDTHPTESVDPLGSQSPAEGTLLQR